MVIFNNIENGIDKAVYPGPKPIAGQSFSICHWNLNSISAHNFTKISLLTAHVLVHNFDIICLSETYLNSEISTDDKNLEIPGYYLLRAAILPILKEEASVSFTGLISL